MAATIDHLPETLSDDLSRFQQEVAGFRAGGVSAAEFRAFRVPQGVYEQREAGTYMLRVRLPAGAVLPYQMRTLAAVARRHGSGLLHVTTRQDIQVHRVLLDDLHPALLELYAAGLSTKGGGGNTVRNITGCYDAGVCSEEAFDVTPCALALTEAMLPDPLSYQLPRKYKIAFSGCSKDCSGAAVNDLGFVAMHRDGVAGFRVYVGGGMGAQSRLADLLEDFVPADAVYCVAEAVKRVFDQHGNRKERNRARLRFLIERIGLEGFRELYQTALAEVRRSGVRALRPRPLPDRPQRESNGTEPPSDGFAAWRDKSLTPQRQAEFYTVRIPTDLGDISADGLERLADVIQQHGEGAARATQQQDLVLRWVHERQLAELHRKLRDSGFAAVQPAILRNIVACAGAATCRLGICLSRGLARAIRDTLAGDGLDLDAVGDIRIHVSGCPNACGRHPIADIGLFGAARRVNGRLVPHYTLQVGGRVGAGDSRLAQGRQPIPARNVPAAVLDLLQAHRQSADYPDFRRFLEAQDPHLAQQLAARHQHVPAFEEDQNAYLDWGASEPFSLAGRGPGECSAGVFDLINADLASAQDASEQGRLYEAVVLASRALLITRGEQARDDREALDLFHRHFVAAKLVDDALGELVIQARLASDAPAPQSHFRARPEEVSRLVQSVQQLYDKMDPSLRFKPAAFPSPLSQPAEEGPSATIDRQVDFRGVTCPLNFVKTKLALQQMQAGEVLSVLLDEPGSRNVPPSVQQEGHQVVSVGREGDAWRLVVRKKD